MRDGVGDPRWRVPFGNFEQGGLVRDPLRERNIGFALLRPSAGRHAFEREGTGSK